MSNLKFKPGFILLPLILLLVVSACSPAAPTAAPVVEKFEVTVLVPETVVVTQVVEVIITATTQPPTATPIPTETPAPQVTADAVVAVPAPASQVNTEGLSAWCFPEGVLYPEKYIDANGTKHEAGEQYGFVSGALEITNIPKTSCTFIYKFDQPVAAGTGLNVHDAGQAKTFLTSALTPAAADPSMAFVTLTHAYIVNPPGWDFAFDFVVNGPDGSQIRTDRVNIHRWDPGVCWDGVKPYWPSLLCREQQDSHPWDYGYTPPPPEVIEEE